MSLLPEKLQEKPEAVKAFGSYNDSAKWIVTCNDVRASEQHMGAITSIRMDTNDADLPKGMIYRDNCISETLEHEVATRIEQLDLKPVEMFGQVTKRLVAQFGVNFPYGGVVHDNPAPFPSWLIEFRRIIADVVPIPPEKFRSLIVQKYPAGAGIGWHRDDEDLYGVVVGASLGGPCRMLFRRAKGERARRKDLAPRSIYVLAGAAR